MASLLQNEFKNEEIHVFVHRKPACKVDLTVRASPSLIEKARKKAIKRVSKEVVLPGFRKGKAPKEIVLKKFEREVEKELETELADLAYTEAQKLANIPPLNHKANISFHTKKITPEEAELSFTFETEPIPPSVEGITFTPKPVARPTVTEIQVEEAIRQMRYFYAEWHSVKDRPIRDSDTIMINLDTTEGNAPERVFNHVRFEVSKERMADWMKELVEGAKAGDVLEGVSRPDVSATEEEKSEFKSKKVRVTILDVEEAVLPELNDAFALKIGAPTVESMKDSILQILNKQADEKVTEEKREQLNQFLMETFSFDLPHSLIEAEKSHRLKNLLQNPNFQKNWEELTKEEKETFEQKLFKEAQQSIRLFYLSRKIVNDAKISITHKEIQDEAISTLGASGQTKIEQIPKEIYALALSKVILAKAQNHLYPFQ